MNIDVFQSMKAGKNIFKLLPDADTKEWYLYIKAFKLVAVQEFYHYCRTQHSIDSEFHSCISRILDEHYPPLEYEHPEEKGYSELPAYVQLARTVF